MKQAIVLTATISPSCGGLAAGDTQERRRQYLKALDFYQGFGHEIFFLENSGFPITSDQEFIRRGVTLCSLPVSSSPERGKGYQEFEMISLWLRELGDRAPRRWIKVTGRYIVKNFASLLAESEAPGEALIIDQVPRSKTSRTYIFSVETKFFLEHLTEIFRRCDDRTNRWIERELFSALSPFTALRFFRSAPRLEARSGSTGAAYPSALLPALLKQVLRNINRIFDSRYLWFSK